jgi:UDP-glucose 6-dehydrogenase
MPSSRCGESPRPRAVTAGCLTQQGHSVIGVDVQSQKVDSLNHGEAPIVEPQLEELLKSACERKVLQMPIRVRTG